jgi:hypothetical protein
MKSKKNTIEITEQEILKPAEVIEPENQPEPEPEPIKQKKVLSVSQLEALAKARIKAQERKKELAELNAKSKGLKEQKLKADAAEFDKLQKQKELEETVRKIDVPTPPPPPAKIEKKKKIKKIIYESENSDEESEEVVIKKKKAPKQPSYSQLADMSVEQQIKNKLQQEKITCFFNQLTGKKF